MIHLRTAYYRKRTGEIVSVDAADLKHDESIRLKIDKDSLFCPSCSERVFFANSSELAKPGRIGYKGAHFRHQKKDKCAIDDCDLRVDIQGRDCYISQRLRIPLFLRPDGKGGFRLSVGFTTSNKEALRNLQQKNFKKLVIKQGKHSVIEIPLEEFLEENNILYKDLPFMVGRQTSLDMVVQSAYTAKLPLSKANEEWSDTMDYFLEGGIFQYSYGNAGEKLQSGSFVSANRPYLMVERAHTNVFIDDTPLEKLSKKYGLLYQRKGYLKFKSGQNFMVSKVIFPSMSQVTPEEYELLFNWLREKFGVLLSDEAKETRPVWPPAVRKSDAYGVQANSVYVAGKGVEKGECLFVHKDYEHTDELPARDLNGINLWNIQLLSRRMPVSFNGFVSGSVASYRAEAYKEVPIHGIKVTTGEETILLETAGQYQLPDVKTVTLSASCQFTICRKGMDPQMVKPGETITIEVKKGERFFLYTCAGVLYDLSMPQKTFTVGGGKYDKYGGRTSAAKYEKNIKYY